MSRWPTLKERFFQNQRQGEPPPHNPSLGPCLVWTARLDQWGYGQIRVSGVITKAHRAAYEMLIGPIPPEVLVLHKCDNAACVNPNHLYTGTHADNMKDAASRARMRRRRGKGFGCAKLTDETVAEIRRKSTARVPKHAIAREFGVSPKTVRLVVDHLAWRHVP